jgi:hypothetical protein
MPWEKTTMGQAPAPEAGASCAWWTVGIRRLSASTDQPRLNTGAKASGAVVFNSFTGPKTFKLSERKTIYR